MKYRSTFAFLLSGLLALGSVHAEEAPIFNGTDLSAWTVKAGKEKPKAGSYWTVKDGEIIGDNPDMVGSNLWTKGEYQDFELSLKFMTKSPDYDSGVFLRAESHQVQIGISRSLKKDLTACIYAPGDGNGKYPAVSDKVAKIHKPGEWNTLRMVVEGKRIRVWLNGEEFVDYESSKIPAKGPIGLQLHQDVHQKIHFRDLKLTVLDGED